MRVIRVTALMALAMLVALSCFSGVGAESPKAALTLMVYMAGSDLESGSGAATADIAEMLRAGADLEKVNVLICTGGAKRWQGGFPSDSVCAWRAEGRRPVQIADYGPGSMGSADTLSRFLRDSAERFPAEQYALILWDHGGGPLNGVCFDELHGADALELDELKAALNDSPFDAENPLEWIGFDACLMASVETAHACASFARYMIASQETEPGSGWNYSFLKHAHEKLSGAEIGRLILESYMEGRDGDEQLLTLSCVDLSALDDVETAMRELFGALGGLVDPSHFSKLSNARRDAKGFGRASTGSDYDLADLYSLAEQYAGQLPDAAAALERALDAAVVDAVGNQEDSHGLSVYYPYYNKEYYQSLWRERYSRLDFVPQYRDFMRSYADMWLGEPLADWSDLRAEALPPRDQAQTLTLRLNDEQRENFASAQVVVVSQLPTGELNYYKVDEIDGVTPDADGVLRASYDYRALYVLDAQGEPLGDAIPYTVVDDMVLIRANLSDKTLDQYWSELLQPNLTENEDAEMQSRKGFLRCRYNEADDTLAVVGFISMLEEEDESRLYGLLSEGEGLYTGKQTVSVDSDEWKWVWFLHFPRQPARDASGALRAYPEWIDPNTGGQLTVEWDEIDNEKPWTLQFRRQQVSGLDLYAQFVVRDTQGNLIGSNLVKIDNPNMEAVEVPERVVAETDEYTVTLKGAGVSGAAFDGGVFVTLDLAEKGGVAQSRSVSAENVCLDRCLVKGQYILNRSHESAGVTTLQLNIPPEDIPAYLEDDVSQTRFDLVIDSERCSVTLDVPLDLGTTRAYSPLPQEPLAAATSGGLDYRLVSAEAQDGRVALEFVVTNTGDERATVGLKNDVWVDGCEWEWALTVPSVALPADTWTRVEMKLDRLSPEPGTALNTNNAPRIDYPTYWDTGAIHSLLLLDNDDNALRFELDTPLALEGRQGAGWSDSPELLRCDELEARLEGVLWNYNALNVIVGVRNLTDRSLCLMPRTASVNGIEGSLSLTSACGDYYFDGMALAPGAAARLMWRVYPDADAMAESGVNEARLAYRYTLEGKADERFCTPAALDFGARGPEVPNGGFINGSDIETTPAASEINSPEAPEALIDGEIPVPERFRDCATVYRARLTPDQAERCQGAALWLMGSRSEMILAGILDLPVSLDKDGELRCEFDGLLACLDNAAKPMLQRVSQTPEGLLYDLRGVSITTDKGGLDGSVDFDTLRLAFDRETGKASVQAVAVSRPVGRLESVRSQSYISFTYEYENGPGSPLVGTQVLRGESGEKNGRVKLSLRPASELGLYALFLVRNSDGSTYAVEVEALTGTDR